jgi:preprotein translocase subunit SecG
MTSTLGSSGVAERNLNRLTIIIAVIWVLAIVTMGLFTRFELI